MKKYKKIYVEITNVCNLKCAFCPETKREGKFMSEEAFTHILTEIKPFTDYIYLHVKGEPLLHPKLSRLLDIAGKEDFKVNITTNGVLINKAADMLLTKEAVRQINFSLHSFDSNENSFTKDEYLDSILDFTDKAVKYSKIIIALRLWNLDEALLSANQRARNLSVIKKLEEHFNLSNKIQATLSENKALKLGERVYLNQDYEFTWPSLDEAEDVLVGTCYGLRTHAAVLVDGTVVPCCLDGEGIINLGNIYKKEFLEIIRGQRASSIKTGFLNNKIVEELCRKCTYRNRFTR